MEGREQTESIKKMAKPANTVEIRVFTSPEKRNELKSKAAANGLTISEYILQNLENLEKTQCAR